MVDAAGRSVAAPLRKGSSFCLFHAVPFSTKPARLIGPVVVIYLDLEVANRQNSFLQEARVLADPPRLCSVGLSGMNTLSDRNATVPRPWLVEEMRSVDPRKPQAWTYLETGS